MSRYHSLKAPRCTHNAAIWAAHDAATNAYWQAAGDRNPEDRPAVPTADGYCAECHAALLQPGAVWPAEVWAWLNAEAVSQCAGHRKPDLFNRAPKLPSAPKARKETPDKHRARLAKAYANTEKDGSCSRVVGRPTPDGYTLTATDGSCALLERGEGSGDPLTYKGWTPGDQWIDLPPAFHLALTRVALLANERTHAIRFTLEGNDLIIHTQHYEGIATERVQVEAHATITHPIVLNAEYLDPLCGVWPLRWYVQDEMSPQMFQPHGTDYRALIMPMRD